MLPSIASFLLAAYRLREQIDRGDEDDSARHHQRIVLDESALHLAEEARAAARRVADAVHRAVDDVAVEEVGAVAEEDHGEVADAVDDAVDDVRVEPRQRPAEGERAADEDEVVDSST